MMSNAFIKPKGSHPNYLQMSSIQNVLAKCLRDQEATRGAFEFIREITTNPKILARAEDLKNEGINTLEIRAIAIEDKGEVTVAPPASLICLEILVDFIMNNVIEPNKFCHVDAGLIGTIFRSILEIRVDECFDVTPVLRALFYAALKNETDPLVHEILNESPELQMEKQWLIEAIDDGSVYRAKIILERLALTQQELQGLMEKAYPKNIEIFNLLTSYRANHYPSRGGGGLMGIVAYGSQDVYLTNEVNFLDDNLDRP